MSVSYVSIGTGTDSSTTTLSLPYPGGTAITAGNLGIAIIAHWGPSRGNTPVLDSTAVAAGWRSVVGDTSSTDGGGGTYGADAGPRDVTAYWWVSSGTGTAVGFTLADADAGAGCRGYVMSFSKSLNKWATPISVAGSDNTSGTSWSVTAASDFGGAGSLNGDMLVVGMASVPDTPTFSSNAVTYASGTYTQRGSGAATAGHDGRHNCGTSTVTTTSSGAPVFTGTASAVCTGSGLFVRLRDLDEIARPSVTQIQAVNRGTL